MKQLALGAAIHFDHELAADPAPLAMLCTSLAKDAGEPLRQWWSTDKASQKPKRLELDKLIAKVAAGETVSAAIESEQRGFLVLAQTTPSARLKEGVPPRQWKYDAVIALGAEQVTRIGAQAVIDALVAFADAVAVKAGVVVWSESLAYASAIVMGASGSELTREQAAAVTDTYFWRSHWGRVIRGPEWGTFLGGAHVAAIGDVAKLPAKKVVPLKSGGAFVQLSSLDEVTTLEAPSPQLRHLREVLAPVLPR
jgi:hypothetical protein